MAAKGTGESNKLKNETGRGKIKKKDVLKYDREVKNFRAETLQRIYLFKAARQEWFATADNETDLQPTSDTVYYSLKMDKKSVATGKMSIHEIINLFWFVVRGFSSVVLEKFLSFLKIFRETRRKLKLLQTRTVVLLQCSYDWNRGKGGIISALSDTVVFFLKKASIIKKMGFNLDKIQPHRRTLRPRGFFTMKRNTSELDFEEMKGKDREAPIIKEFRKKAKRARKKLIKKQKKLEKQERKKRRENVGAGGDKVFNELVGAGTEQESDPLKAGAERKGLGDDAKKDVNVLGADVAERKGDGDDMEKKEILIKPSSEAFDNIIKDLEHVYDFDTSGVTDEDIEEMKRIWKETENIPDKKKKSEAGKGKRRNLQWLKKFGMKCLNKGKLLSRKWKGEKVDWPPGFKPCTCQIAEGDKLIVLKTVCNCSEQCDAKGEAVQNNPVSENLAKGGLLNDVVGSRDDLPATTASGTIVGKIADSLEMIRKKVIPKSSQTSRISAGTNGEVKYGTPAPATTTLKDNELKQTNGDVSKSKPENGENKKSNIQETEGGSIREKSSSIIYIKNFKSRRNTKTPLYTEVLSEQKEAESAKEDDDDLTSVENSVKEVKDVKPKNSLLSSSGRSKIPPDTAARLSEDARYKSQDPKPILGKGKRKKGLIEQGHVSFDVKDGNSLPANSNTNEESVKKKKKMQTVMSVMSIIKRRD